jgi:peptidoglycan/LPS O-acetylase OafA/YrhL
VAGERRVVALDGLRALAALVVVFTHATGAIHKTPWQALALYASPLAPLLNATGAVHVFFVLSGYCLTASALRASSDLRQLAPFYVRRVARIHVPYVFVVLLTWVASTWLYPAPVAGVSPWMRDLMRIRGSFAQILPHLRFPGDVSGLMPQGWTLEVEMVASLLMPLLAWIAWRAHWGVLVAGGLCLLALSQQPLATPRYVLDFAAGIALFLERERIESWLARWPRGVGPLIGLAGLAVLSLPLYLRLADRAPRLEALGFAAGATLLVLAADHSASLRRFLGWRPVAFLGRVSYSIYLLHFVLLVLCTPLLGDGLGPVAGVGFVALVALLASALAPISYYGVERPSIRAGNAACRWLARVSGGRLRAPESA